MSRQRQRRAAGFTLLELLVSLAILAVAMLIASRLLLESHLRLSYSARRALQPAATLALEQVRADVRAASRVAGRDFEWTWDALVLSGHPAGKVLYEKVGTDLVREIFADGASMPHSERIVMRGVNVWRWRHVRGVALPLVEIELGYREIPRLGPLVAAGQREAPVPILRSRHLTVGPRQAAGRRGW